MVAIIGAGISGLSLAYFLEKKGINYVLLEGSDRVGGLINSTKIGHYLLETGPNSILCDKYLTDFLKSIDLEDSFIYPNQESKNRYIFKKGKYQKLPDNPISLLKSSFFSWKTKLSIFLELRKKSISTENETLSTFIKRRFNQEVVDYALNPFISGIYAGDPSQLLLNKTFPILMEYEKKYGSVLKGFIKNNSGDRKQSLNFKNGMEQLPIALSKKISHIKLNSQVNKIIKNKDHKYIVTTDKEEYLVNKIVICTSATNAAYLLRLQSPLLSELLHKIKYPPMIAVYTAFKKSDVAFKLEGFGGLNPKTENQFCAGSIWTSSIMPDRCPVDEVLFTSFVGGTQYETQTQLTDQEIKENVSQELIRQYTINSKPTFQYLKKWPLSIPQYTIELNEVYDLLHKEMDNNLYFCSNWHHGVSLGDCIKKGDELSNQL